jgi:transcriptional regulator with XRE-family HTH domain
MARDFDKVRQELASTIRTLRAAQQLSQEQIALVADVDRTYVSQIERAVGNPSLLVLCKLGAVLGVDVCDLLGASALPSPPRRRKRPTQRKP